MHTLSNWSFDSQVSEVFDTHVRQSVPLYDHIQEAISHLSDFFVKDNSVIYDLGCSTGETIHQIQQRHPNKHLHFKGIDDSYPMLVQAEAKNYGVNHTSFIHHSIDDYVFEEKSHLILSILTLQFLSIEKRELVIQNVFDALYKGSAFVFVEKTYPVSPKSHDIFTQIYHDHKEMNGLSAEAIRTKDKSIRSVMTPLSIHENVDMLKNTGFSTVDVFFKYLNFTGFIAIK